jgi:hypothetical protein
VGRLVEEDSQNEGRDIFKRRKNMRSFEREIKTLGCGFVLAGALTLGACSPFEEAHPGNPSTQTRNVAAAKTSVSGSQSFDAQLARNYYAISSRRNRDEDWTDSDYFARKSLAADQGGAIMPEMPVVPENPPLPGPSEFFTASGTSVEPHLWLIPGNGNPVIGTPAALTNSRRQLVAALDGGGRARFPALAARTQASFDCWVERSEMLGARAVDDQCHKDFVRDYTDLTLLLNPPAVEAAYFDWNSVELKPEAQEELQNAAARIKNGTARLKIVGKADRSGTDRYNMALSARRADVIREALIADGLSEDRIDVQWTGEQQLPVATNDGVREQKNRVVEIDTQMPSSQVAALPD